MFCSCPKCCDDVTVTSDEPGELQVLVSQGEDLGGIELFLLQLIKSVVMPISGRTRITANSDTFKCTINGEPMSVVQDATYMGIRWSTDSNEPTVEENIKKSGRPCLHGHNRLDPKIAVHFDQVYVVPTFIK